MNDKSIKVQLGNIREWAKAKIQSGSEPPWAWFQYMKLTETVDAILSGMESVRPTGNSRQSGSRQDTSLRLAGC